MPADGQLFPNLLHFGRLLRALGVDTRAGGMLEVAEALAHVEIGRRDDFYHTLQTLLVARPQDRPVFDAAFRLFWRAPDEARPTAPATDTGRRKTVPPGADTPPAEGEGAGTTGGSEPALQAEQVAAMTYSAREVSRTKDFARFTDAEVAGARAMMAALDWELGAKTTRRWRAGDGPTVDIRRAVRQNLRFGGEMMTLPRRARRVRTRPLVLLCDVSGSMERYSRMLLHFVHTLAGGLDRVESFLFSTRLTRVTRQLARRGVDDVVPALPRQVPDFAGGTRIGEALGEFNVRWARRVMGRGPVVLLISDGWDRGDPDRLSAGMARLQRSCHRLIWLNPLLGSPRYQPLTRGMQAALPWIDDFLPVHNLASLDALATHLGRLPARRNTRRGRRVASNRDHRSVASPYRGARRIGPEGPWTAAP